MMCERRGEQIRTAIPQHARHGLTFDAHVHTHIHTPRLTGPGFISGCADGWCLLTGRGAYHPPPHTIAIHGQTLAELKGSSTSLKTLGGLQWLLRVVNLRVNNLNSCLCFCGPCVLTQHAALSGPLWNTSRSNIFVSDRCASTHLHQPRESLPDYHKPCLIFIHSSDHFLMLFKIWGGRRKKIKRR